ncbi:MAG TPA: hypothetical protein VF799_05540 [Geobacteraceae bacterium]
MEKIMMGRLFRPCFRGIAEIDVQIGKFRELRDSGRRDVHALSGTWTLSQGGPERDAS